MCSSVKATKEGILFSSNSFGIDSWLIPEAIEVVPKRIPIVGHLNCYGFETIILLKQEEINSMNIIN